MINFIIATLFQVIALIALTNIFHVLPFWMALSLYVLFVAIVILNSIQGYKLHKEIKDKDRLRGESFRNTYR